MCKKFLVSGSVRNTKMRGEWECLTIKYYSILKYSVVYIG